jgi:hypothetical protein
MKPNSALFSAAIILIATTASAPAAQIDISGLVNSDLTTYSGGSNYPQNGGTLTVAGVTFQLATIGPNNHTAVIQGSTVFDDTQTYSIPVNLFGITVVNTLINSAFGSLGTDIGSLVFVGAGGETFTYTLTEGFNVRDHFQDGFVNSATNLAGTADFGPPDNLELDRLDMQRIVLPAAFASDTLTRIELIVSVRAGMAHPSLLQLMLLQPLPSPAPSSVPAFPV